MKIIAKLKHLRMAPRKVRLVADLIRGMDVQEAQKQLKFLNKKAALPLLKLLNSAIANAKHNFNLEKENLYISQILVDGGPSLKRWMPRAMGRATPILKRTCHITLLLDQKKGVVRPFKESKKEQKETDFVQQEIKKEEKEERVPQIEEKKIKKRKIVPQRPFGASSVAKKRFFSRQTFGNLKKDIKRMFRRKHGS